jgi:hypothetical protein
MSSVGMGVGLGVSRHDRRGTLVRCDAIEDLGGGDHVAKPNRG